MVFGRSSEAESGSKNDPIGLNFFFSFRICLMAKKSYFMKKIDLLVKKMTLFSKLHQKLSKKAKISKNAILKSCGELNSKQN